MSSYATPYHGDSAHLKTFERVNKYPIVSDSFVFALSYYYWAKSKNVLLDVTLNKLEGALKTVREKTEPIAAEKLHFIDETVCQQLEKFEKLCPLILQPTNTITSIPGHIFHGQIQPSLKHVIQPVTFTYDVVSKTSCAAASVISHVLPSALSSREAAMSVLNKTEQLIDRFLPEQETDTDGTISSSIDTEICKKIRHLSTKTQHRIFKKVIIDIERFRVASLEKLAQIQSTIYAIKLMKSASIESVQYEQVIKQGLQYSDHLKDIITNGAKSLPKIFLCNATSALDFLNDKLFVVRNLIQDSTNRNLISEQRINQAADIIDFTRSWIEYVTDNLKEYYSGFQNSDRKDYIIDDDEEDFEEDSSGNDEEEVNRNNQ